MTEIGSAPWVEQQQLRVASIEVDPDIELVVQQTVLAETPQSWHIVIADGSARLRPGAHPDPDVTLSADPATIDAISSGRSSAQREFLDGRLRIAGDIRRLLAVRDAIAP